MKYCSTCGKEILEKAVVCPACGCSQKNDKEEDRSSFGWAVLGFCIPIAGLILYLVWKDSTPLKAKSVGRGALTSVIVGVIFCIIYAVVIASFVNSAFSALAVI